MNGFDAETAEGAVLAALRALDADYEAIAIEPAYANTAAFCERYGYGRDISANCIIVAGKTEDRRHAACLVQATRRLDVNRTVRRRLGVRKASFAPAEETIALTSMLPDGVTPFGLPEGLPLWVDAGVVEHERVVVGGGSRSLKILVASEVFHRMLNAEVVEGLAQPPG